MPQSTVDLRHGPFTTHSAPFETLFRTGVSPPGANIGRGAGTGRLNGRPTPRETHAKTPPTMFPQVRGV